jgi:hypothetical protein
MRSSRHAKSDKSCRYEWNCLLAAPPRGISPPRACALAVMHKGGDQSCRYEWNGPPCRGLYPPQHPPWSPRCGQIISDLMGGGGRGREGWGYKKPRRPRRTSVGRTLPGEAEGEQKSHTWSDSPPLCLCVTHRLLYRNQNYIQDALEQELSKRHVRGQFTKTSKKGTVGTELTLK